MPQQRPGSFSSYVTAQVASPRWVFVHRVTRRIRNLYPDSVYIRPAQQRQLMRDYARLLDAFRAGRRRHFDP